MAKLDQLLQQVRNQLGAEFISTDVVGMDGLSIAGLAASTDFNAGEVSTRFAMVMKLAQRASATMGIGNVDDNLVTTDRVYVLSRFLGNGSYYWGLTVAKDATLGAVRLLMNEYANQIWDAIPSK